MVKNEDRSAYVTRIKGVLENMRPMQDYKNKFVEECDDKRPRISTGILAFDIALNGGLSNELYIMGAETSTGKSAFLMSIAQNIAMQGINVLYFALEMGRSEFVARGISTISHEHYFEDSTAKLIKASDVLYWAYDKKQKEFKPVPYSCYEEYADEYFRRYGEHLYILEAGTEGFTAKDIANIAYSFKKKTKEPVVVFVDYLQIIKADPDDRSQSDRKTKIDVSVTTLKTLASQVGMPVFTVSSVRRENYNKKVSSDSFKESGDTEYTSGVVIGWNWKGVTNEKDEDAREAMKQKCKKRGYRIMNLEVLKYRNSQRDSGFDLIYYPAYSHFVGPSADWIMQNKDEEMSSENNKRVIIG